jgi:hypothetical protein
MNQNDYADQCRANNPEMHVTINGVTRKLTQEEYDEAVEAWALMRYHQDNPEQQPPTELPQAPA